MSLAGKKAALTKAVKGLEDKLSATTTQLEFIEDRPTEEAALHKEDLQLLLTTVETRSENLDKALDNFETEVDKIPTSNETATKDAEIRIAGAIDVREDAIDILIRLRHQLKRISPTTTHQSSREDIRISQPQPDNIPTPHPPQPFGYKEYLMENTRITKFKGDVWEFEAFWTQFEELIHKSDRPELFKFNKLLNLLEGEPRELIARFKVTGDNYTNAIALLKKKYNDQEKIVSQLTSQLKNETAPSGSTTDQRKLFEKILITTNQLKDYQENVDTRMMKNEIISKFARRIQENVFKKKLDFTGEWTLDKLLEDLENVIIREETLNMLLNTDNSKHQKANDTKPDNKKSFRNNDDPCIFCKEKGHYFGRCPAKTNPIERLQILNAESRCTRCTRTGHTPTECKAKMCPVCDKDHHSSCCPEKHKDALPPKIFKKQEQKKSSSPSTTTSALALQVDNSIDQVDTADNSSTETHTIASAKTRGTNRGFIPTISTTAYNHSTNKWDQITVMLDSGSDQTFITRALLTKWKLPNLGEIQVEANAFDAASQKKQFGRSQIQLRLKEANLQMDVYVADSLVGLIPKAPLSHQDMQFLLQNKLELNEDSLKTSSEPDMILGTDHWMKIVTGKLIQLPSGIGILETKDGFATMGSITSKSNFIPTKFEQEQVIIMAMNLDLHDHERETEDEQMRDFLIKKQHERPAQNYLAALISKETTLSEATASINRRPLTTLEDDINADAPIRPCDFIIQKMEIRPPLEGELNIKEDFRPAAEHQSKETMLNTVEALKSSINTLNASSDGVVRDVDFLAPNGRTLNRAINLIVPLELDDEDEEDETERPSPQLDPPKEDPEESSDNKTRYKLRTRKTVNHNEDEPMNNFASSSGPKWTNMLFICTVMMLFSGTSTTDNKIHCTPNGIKIEGQFEDFESCVENYCTTKSRWELNWGQGINVWFPTAIKIHPHHVTTKIYDGHLLHLREMDCEAVPFCETIDCTVCWTNILNPECHISWAILGVGATLFLLLLVLHATCNVPLKIKDVLGMGWTIFCLCVKLVWWLFTLPLVTASQWFWRRPPVRRSTWKRLFTVVTLLALTRTTSSCQDVDIITQFETVCDNDGSCKTLTEEVMHLNNAHKEGCLRIGKNGTVLRDIRIELKEIELHCVKRTITHTQDIETRVWSTKRCPHMGSCVEDKCAHVNRHTLIPELDNVNSYVGNTGCTESCGTPGCGCFSLSSGCLFYRIYALPRENSTMEVFSCVDYTPLVNLRLTVTTLNSWKNQVESVDISSPLGHTTTFKDMTFTVMDINTPPSPSLNSWFITNSTAMATWTENMIPHYQCDQTLEHCVLDEDCQCTPAEDTMICKCKDTDMEELFRRPDRVLPVQAGHLRLEQDGDNVKGKIKFSTSTTMSIKMADKWTTAIVKSKESCSVSSTTATGCYKCEKGATAEITCKTSAGNTTASIECGEEEFAVACSPAGTTTALRFFGKQASFQRHCTVDCGGKTNGHFEVTGILKYSGSIWTAMWRLLNGNTTIFNEINIPDVGHMATSYMTFMKTMFAVIAAVGIAFLLTYSIITNTGVTIAKTLLKIVLWILWQPIRGFICVIKLIRTTLRRRRGQAYVIVLLLIIQAATANPLTYPVQGPVLLDHSPTPHLTILGPDSPDNTNLSNAHHMDNSMPGTCGSARGMPSSTPSSPSLSSGEPHFLSKVTPRWTTRSKDQTKFRKILVF